MTRSIEVDRGAEPRLITSTVFRQGDQLRFAEFSGDFNPMHMDAGFARRTQAGAPVVHGMHQVLWLLGHVAGLMPAGIRVKTVKARFPRFLYLGETASLMLVQQSGELLRLRINADRAATTNIVLGLEPGTPGDGPTERGETNEYPPIGLPREPAFADIRGLAGDLPISTCIAKARAMFPEATALIGADRVAAIAALSQLVGMICPGLHSIFSSVDLRLVDRPDVDRLNHEAETARLRFSVSSTDEAHGFVQQKIEAIGIEGEIEAFMRTPPVSQPSVAQVASSVQAGEFAGSVALIVGASRGLGEVVAKTIAAGGGRVIATYAVGQTECAQVAQEIKEYGGRCDVLHYDALQPAAEQLQNLPALPTTLYYFATTRIFGRKQEVYDAARFNKFTQIYVDGFYRLCSYLREHRREHQCKQLTVFYPSSTAVESRPADMTAYAMAKSAGELLCADLNRFWPEIRITMRRLPRILTDQTATVVANVEAADATEVMLPIVREIEKSHAVSRVSRSS